jgi:adenosylcobyric acid synthase
LVRKGIRVAPFKAQNMSNNSAVTVEGGEIGRAQAMQARAAGLAPSVRFNPILLKPGSDTTSQLVLKGQVVGTATAAEYWSDRNRLAAVVQDELAQLRTEFDAVICEGAGSPAEINLRATDLVNMGLARAANLPVIIVGDIDRGGLLAHLFGTVAVLEPDDQALIAGFIVNKFRGDVSLLEPGLRQLAELSGRPTYGVLPYTDDLWLDTEDAVPVLAHRVLGTPQPPRGSQWLRVAVLRLPRISNSTDVEALACEPGVLVRWVREPADLADTDVIVVPGTKSTVADLGWLRDRGLDQAIRSHAASGRAVLGICGGFQMLCRSIDDPVESRSGRVEAMGMLDADIVFAHDKVLCRRQGSLAGYEIHHGRVARCAEAAWFEVDGCPQGYRRGQVFGTHWHGLLDNDDFRRQWLSLVAAAAGREGFVVADGIDVAARRDAQLDVMADLLDAHLDVDAVIALLDDGPPSRPTIVAALR